MAGEIIAGRFELIEHIAGGGSGSVWLARDLRQAQLCAAKVMRQSYSGELLRFVREQGVKFDHPHLLTPYGWAAVDDRVVIASALMRGGNLHTAMQDYGAFSQHLVAEILVQLLDGLEHVHESGWIHRDVKPANVLLECTGTGVPKVRLTDFGIAAHRDQPRLTEHGMVVGTHGFLAPELNGTQAPEASQDLYALGVLAVQLLNPQLRGAELAEKCRSAHFGVGTTLTAVLDGLLDERPERRIAAAHRAPDALSVLRNKGGCKVASGDAFEVFDQFEDIVIPAENSAPATPSPTAPAPPTTGEPQQSEPVANETVLRKTPHPALAEEPEPSVDKALEPERKAETASQAKDRPKLSKSIVLPLAAVVLAVLLGGLSLWLVFGSSNDPAPVQRPAQTEQLRETDKSSAPEDTQAATKDEPAQEPSKQQQPAASETAKESEPAEQDKAPEGIDVPISSNVRAGEDCAALEAGLVVTGADGHRLTCEADGAEYYWVADS